MSVSRMRCSLTDALKRCDLLVGTGQLEYFYQLYDPATGGFYYSISSRDSAGTTPFAEGTLFLLECLRAGGIEPPEWYKAKVGAWIRSHQDEDGWFYEELWGKNTAGPRKNRDLSFSVSILRNFCGMEPVYTLPQDRMKSASAAPAAIPEYLESEAKMIAYLDSLDWTTKSIWGTGQKLATAVSLVEAAGMYELVHEYAKSRQNPETGLWGEGIGWMNTNGAMKLSSYFRDAAHPYPRMDTMLESVLAIFSGDVPAEHATYIWNPFVLMNNALRSMGGRADEMRARLFDVGADIVNFAVDSALRLQRPDGGFSSDIDKAQSFQQGWRYGLGLADESDVDGTAIAGQRLRTTIHDVFAVPCSHDYYKPYAADFWERLRTKPPVVKTLPYLECKKINGDQSMNTAIEYMNARGCGERVRHLTESSATVALAAKALSVTEGEIAKTLSFMLDGAPILIVMAGDVKTDNAKYRAQFNAKAKMLTPDEALTLVGHAVGGVCPFGIKEGVKVYLDESLRRFELVWAACGAIDEVIGLTMPELETLSGSLAWVDVSKPAAGA